MVFTIITWSNYSTARLSVDLRRRQLYISTDLSHFLTVNSIESVCVVLSFLCGWHLSACVACGLRPSAYSITYYVTDIFLRKTLSGAGDEKPLEALFAAERWIDATESGGHQTSTNQPTVFKWKHAACFHLNTVGSYADLTWATLMEEKYRTSRREKNVPQHKSNLIIKYLVINYYSSHLQRGGVVWTVCCIQNCNIPDWFHYQLNNTQLQYRRTSTVYKWFWQFMN